MSNGNKTLAARFADAHGRRSAVIQRAKEAAAYTIPSVLTEFLIGQDGEIVCPYQNVGSDGIANLTSKLILALFPPAMTWFQYLPSARLQAEMIGLNRTLDLEAFRSDVLYPRELVMASQLESSNYRVAHRTVLEQILVAANSCYRIDADYRLTTFRLDQFVQKKSGNGKLLWVISCELADPLALDDAALATAGLTPEKAMEMAEARQLKLYTAADRQRDDTWTITQEVNDKVINLSEGEPVSPFVCIGYEELPGEDYSRSFVELKIGDLRSLNGLSKAILDGMVAFARMNPIVDPTKMWDPKHIMVPNGQVIIGRVLPDGRPDGIGFLTTSKVGDFSVAMNHAATIEKRLGKSMLLESSMQPVGERVTATQIMRIARELEGALGGVYAQIAEECQRPLLKRFEWQMERDKILAPLPDVLGRQRVETRILTGMEALNRATELDKLLAALQVIGSIPGAADRLRMDVVVDRMLQAMSIDTTGIVMTDEEYAAKRAEAQQQALAALATQQAIQSTGRIAEQQAATAAA